MIQILTTVRVFMVLGRDTVRANSKTYNVRHALPDTFTGENKTKQQQCDTLDPREVRKHTHKNKTAANARRMHCTQDSSNAVRH